MVETGSNLSSAAALGIKGGTATITAGNNSVNVPHQLGAAPSWYQVSPITNSFGVDIFVSAVDATNITVNMDFTQSSDVVFSWAAGK